MDLPVLLRLQKSGGDGWHPAHGKRIGGCELLLAWRITRGGPISEAFLFHLITQGKVSAALGVEYAWSGCEMLQLLSRALAPHKVQEFSMVFMVYNGSHDILVSFLSLYTAGSG